MALRILTELDHAKIQYYHFKSIIIAGMGLFTDAYDLFCISPVMKLIGRIYYDHHDGNPGVTQSAVLSATVAVALVGTAIGQLVFGYLGDHMGRRRLYGLSLLLMVFGSLGSGFSICRTRGCVIASLSFFRFVTGRGIGGDYPLSATIMSEFANKRTRGSFIAAVFSMQGFGILASSAVTMVVAKSFNWATRPTEISPMLTPESADLAWRIILMMGAVPAALTLYWRMGMPETARFTALVEQDVIKATNDMRVLEKLQLPTVPEDIPVLPGAQSQPPPTYGLFSNQFLSRHGRHLFACAIAWLLVDIPFYGTTLFQSQILYHQWLTKPTHVNAYEEAFNVAKFQAILAAASTIPGYWATVYFIDRIGRRKIQMMGFLLMAVFLFAMAGLYHQNWCLIVFFGLTSFFSNFGPNTTTFIVPAELFPARFRSTCHGISGASGKLGAIAGTMGFLWAVHDNGTMYALIIVGGICIVGMVHTYVFTPETKGTSLEENEGGETEDNREEENIGTGELQGNASDTSQRNTTPLRHHPQH